MSQKSQASIEDQIDQLYQQMQEQDEQKVFQSQFIQRSWLKNRGKQDLISFSDKALIQLHKYFNSLDQKGTGSIGVDQLQDPFIAFGLCDARQEIADLIKSVDLDGSGTIQFNQFLDVMLKIKRGKSSSSKNSAAMYDFFNIKIYYSQGMSNGQLGDDFDQDLSFKLNVSQFRRKKLLESIMSTQKQKKQKGSRILQNFKKQVQNNPYLRQTLNETKKQTGQLYGLDSKSIKKIH